MSLRGFFNEKESKSKPYKTKERRPDKYIKATVNTDDSDIESIYCPLCGSKMNQKTGPYGIFYGCSKFPKCRGKRTGLNMEEKIDTIKKIDRIHRQRKKKLNRR